MYGLVKNNTNASLDHFWTGFPATQGIRENLENEFQFFQTGKTQGI